MEKKDTLYSILTAVLLVLAAAFLLRSMLLPALISLALSPIPLLLLLHQKTAAQKKADTDIADLSKALDAEKAQHERELRKLAQSSIEDLEDFRSILSHQLRMPLSIVQGYADILIKDMVTDEDTKKEYLAKIVDRTQYISELLSNQLSIYRNVDEAEPVFKHIDLISLVNRAGEDMQTVAMNVGIEIQCVTALSSLMIDADPYQLNKVLFNILENSLKYMGRDGHISLLTVLEGEHAFITIRDDGMGLDSEETSHIFELNYQGSNKKAGHGHGLYLAKHAVEAHGGTISAQSAPGMGMSIRITLPLRHENTAESLETDK